MVQLPGSYLHYRWRRGSHPAVRCERCKACCCWALGQRCQTLPSQSPNSARKTEMSLGRNLFQEVLDGVRSVPRTSRRAGRSGNRYPSGKRKRKSGIRLPLPPRRACGRAGASPCGSRAPGRCGSRPPAGWTAPPVAWLWLPGR